ncbi:MAG: SDR family oxidoreductase [Candidatus Omnitrophica bacterium]|jgi:dTDP-glucose 4,6-dehydratase|nr:SDR family oxidoreductase [Candidatus Omnitrophota bacterium]MDD5081044.1 SDR family oxidoreductase [Candidatus Omnitrophota bacterium]MDD5441010.1 SDR family oxidoreductase [Candidatus Omnitrophota bacterium]
MKKKHILISGGAGFIGSHLCDRLLDLGAYVICVDNLLTGSEKNIKHLYKNKYFKFLKHDVIDSLDVKGDIDYILHFASPASPRDYYKYPIATLEVGAIGTRNLLELARKKRAVFLLASTSEVYGDPLVNPQKETYWGNVNPIGPRSVYDEAKRFSEAITLAYHRKHKIDTKIVRIFNTYGPRMRARDGRAIPEFIEQALTNKPVTAFGNGKQTRSFAYIDDLIDGLLLLLNSGLNTPVNIGNPNEMTINSLAELIINLVGSNSKIVYKPLPLDDPKLRRPDISLAKKELKWRPKVDIKKGLGKTIEYFRNDKK